MRAERSGDPTLAREVAVAFRFAYPEQWHDHDFAAIAAAFDRLMKTQGWHRPR
jgi:hypothetical protein